MGHAPSHPSTVVFPPTFENFPIGHPTQFVSATSKYVPAGHSSVVHMVIPGVERRPVAHASHWVLAVSPLSLEEVPAGHGEHTEEEAEAKLPAGHSSVHSEAPKKETLSSTQSLHC